MGFQTKKIWNHNLLLAFEAGTLLVAQSQFKIHISIYLLSSFQFSVLLLIPPSSGTPHPFQDASFSKQ